MMRALKLLAGLKFLRGSVFDIFGYTAERKHEISLIKEYEDLVHLVLDKLSKDNYQLCVSILETPLEYKGYGHVKEKNIRDAKANLEKLLKELEDTPSVKQAS